MDKRCEQGHFYDPSKYSSCPYCGVKVLNPVDTTPHAPSPAPAFPALPIPAAPVPDLGRTVGVLPRELVVGWLVCIEGKNRGRDYRIRSENNRIGRSREMEICIENDSSVSRFKHAVISYNPRKNSFKLSPGESSSLVYLNDQDIDSPAELKPYDLIQLGETKLIFIPFCGDVFQWDKAKENAAE
jgi:hypothetical protein